MSKKTDKRRADLRVRIVDAAEKAVLKGGMSAVRARDLAKEAGCALGAIYNVFDDMQDIVLEVNSRTYKRMGEEIATALADNPNFAPADKLVLLGHTYFAQTRALLSDLYLLLHHGRPPAERNLLERKKDALTYWAIE